MKKNESKGIWLFDPGPFGPEGSEPHRPRRVRAWIVVTVVVALVLAGLGVWQVLRVRGAVASCESMAAQATAAYEDLLKLAESGELKDAEAITADQVEDPDTVTGLAAAVDKAGETVSIGVCGVDWYDLYSNRITEKPTRGKEQFESKRQALRKAMDAVVASRDAKTLAAATSALKSKTDQAATLLKESDGKVQDDTTRQTLGKAIDQARELLDANDDAKAMNDATTSLDQATAAVNDSVKAKSDADAKAAAEAAAAQAAQQAQQSYTPSYTGGYTGGYSGGYTPSYSGGSSSGGSTSSGGSIFDRLPSAIGGTGDAPCTYPECCVPVCIDGECQPCS